MRRPLTIAAGLSTVAVVVAIAVGGSTQRPIQQLQAVSGPALRTAGGLQVALDTALNGDAGVYKHLYVIGDAGVEGIITSRGLNLRTTAGPGACSLALQGQIRQIEPVPSFGFPSVYFCDGFRWRLLVQDTSVFFSTVGIISGIDPGDIFAAAAAVGTEGRILSCTGVVRSPGVGGGSAQLSIRELRTDAGTSLLCRISIACTSAENTVLPVSFCTSEDGGTARDFPDYLDGGSRLVFQYDTPSGCTQLPEVTGTCQAQVWKASLP